MTCSKCGGKIYVIDDRVFAEISDRFPAIDPDSLCQKCAESALMQSEAAAAAAMLTPAEIQKWLDLYRD